MTDFFLRLELDTSGITAQIIRQSNKHGLIEDDCRVFFKDLPDPEEGENPFNAGMDAVAQQLDLGLCSTAIIFVCPFSVSFRNIDLPFSSENKIKQILPFELDLFLPYGNKTHISDFHRLNLENNADMILTASVLESDIETYFSTLGRYDIRPVIITHKGYAVVAGFLEDNTEVSTGIFIHIADHIGTLVLVKDRKPCMVRVFNAGQNDPETFAASVNQTVIGFEQRTGLVAAFDVFVSSEEDDQTIDLLYDALERSSESAPWLKIVESKAQKTLTRMKFDGTSLLSKVVPGKRIKYLFNFCEGRYGPRSFLKRHVTSLAIAIALVFFVFFLSIININMDISTLENKIAAIDHKAVLIFKSTFPEKLKIKDPYLQMKADVQATVKKSGAAGEKKLYAGNKEVSMVEILSEISQKIDTSIDMEISRILYAAGQIVLTGSTDNFNNVDKIKGKIETSDLFGKVRISSAAADKKEDKVNFKFIIEM